LPFAFSASEAKEVWIWFYCAVVIAVSIRSSLMSRRGIYRLWKLVLINSCVLGIFGVIQFLSGTDRIFWVKRIPYQHFFASFGYSNHAGSYFILMLFLAGSMLVRRIFRHQPARFTLKTFFLLAASLLYLLCANLTLSRYAILGSWVGVIVVAVYVARRLWRKGTPALKLNLTVLLVFSGLVAIYASFSLAGAMLGKELSSFLRLQDVFLGSGRMIMFRAGLSVWRESPLFGVGPWGFRHLVGLHLDESLYRMLRPGAANLHNDALQYLVEAGVVGFGLMAGIVGVLIYRIRLSILRNWMPGIILLVGVAAIALQSMFDLPMRNPAVFYCWLAIIAGASKISSEKLYEEKALIKNDAPASSGSVSEGNVTT
jgi:O-antigen ligase